MWSKSTKLWPGRRDVYPWAHVSYLLKLGPFHLPSKSDPAHLALIQDPDQADRYALFSLIYARSFTHLLSLKTQVHLPLPRRSP